ncbi:MAG: formate/nitrite transporter family protein [Muribaculaceae bacterium]|nr:formate/nitrite transporter family protein [Muribaculaceae bacterium]
MTRKRLIFITRSLYAGVFIGIGSIVYMLNPGIVGAILFSIGLFGCINLRLNLFTGKVGYATALNGATIADFFFMLMANVLGIGLLTGLFFSFADVNMPAMQQTAVKIVNTRLSTSLIGLLVGSIGCGMLMSHAVDRPTRSDADYNNILSYIPMLYCVPVFIMSCFPHCIADIGYYTVYTIGGGFNADIIAVWAVCVLGNIIGCQLMGRCARLLMAARY